MLEEVAAGTGQRMPDEVYLIPEFNAWVRETEEPGRDRGKRVMGIGLPLFLTLPVPSLRAILAHEFGHYHGGHERETLRFYRVSRVLTSTVNRVRFFSSIVWLPLYLYYQFFRTVTMAVSRIQEYEADRLAASLEGPAALGHGLQLLHAMAPMYDGLWSSDIKSMLDAGYRPPILEGFRRVSGTEHFRRVTREVLEESMKQRRAKWTDSHPSLPQRLFALDVHHSAPVLDPDGAAMGLLGDTDGMEDALLTGRDLSGLKPIAWEEAGERIEIPEVIRLVGKNGKVLRGMTPRSLPTTKRQIKKLTYKTRAGWKGHLNDEFRKHTATLVLGGALILLLREQGWRFDWLPGEPIVCHRDGQRIHPYKVVDDLLDGSLALDEWIRTAEQAGIADANLEAVSLRARGALTME
jgi:hypothetical protein